MKWKNIQTLSSVLSIRDIMSREWYILSKRKLLRLGKIQMLKHISCRYYFRQRKSQTIFQNIAQMAEFAHRQGFASSPAVDACFLAGSQSIGLRQILQDRGVFQIIGQHFTALGKGGFDQSAEKNLIRQRNSGLMAELAVNNR